MEDKVPTLWWVLPATIVHHKCSLWGIGQYEAVGQVVHLTPCNCTHISSYNSSSSHAVYVRSSVAIAKHTCLLTSVAHQLDRLGSPRFFHADWVYRIAPAPYAELTGSQDNHTWKWFMIIAYLSAHKRIFRFQSSPESRFCRHLEKLQLRYRYYSQYVYIQKSTVQCKLRWLYLYNCRHTCSSM